MSQPTILHIETSTNVCSVAVSSGANLIFSKSNSEGMNHAALLSVFIQEALILLKKENKTLDAVAVSSGPGSYTGLRIGLSTAKGICYALDIPLLSINTLELIAHSAIKKSDNEEDSLFCAMLDARRMEVYSAFYRADESNYRITTADIITEDSYIDILNDHKIYFLGNGAEKCKPFITHSNAFFIDKIDPLAENMIELALKKYEQGNFEDLAYFEPFYLKEFQATTPRKLSGIL